MNKKLFLKTFIISIIALIVLSVVVWAINETHKNVGGGEELSVLDDKAGGNLFTGVTETRNIIVMGTDKSGLHSDVIMIFSVSPKKGAIACTSIPRDTRVNYRGSYIKITEVMAYGGEEAVIQTVKDISGIKIHDYVVFNFKAVEDVINALGGVEFNVPQNMFYQDPEQDLYINLTQGNQILNGDKSLQLLRFRSYPMGDIERTKVQREFMNAVFTQKANIKYIPYVPKVYAAITNNIRSSISLADAKEYAEVVAKMGNAQFKNVELPHTLATPFVILNRAEVRNVFMANFS